MLTLHPEHLPRENELADGIDYFDANCFVGLRGGVERCEYQARVKRSSLRRSRRKNESDVHGKSSSQNNVLVEELWFIDLILSITNTESKLCRVGVELPSGP